MSRRWIPRLAVLAAACAVATAVAGCASAHGSAAAPPVEDVVLRFDTPAAMDDWVVTGGEWKVADGLLHGRSLDPVNAAHEYVLYATPFAEIDRVVIRGGLECDAPRNFRFAVGSVGVILNWEVRDENLVHHGYRSSSFGPRALTPGKESEVVLECANDRVRLVVDDRLLWEDRGTLSGTLALSAVLRSRMWVREIRVTGRPLRGLRVTEASAPVP